MQDVEKFAAERLAKVLDRAAEIMADGAEEIRRLAALSREGAKGEGYAYFASRAHSIAVNALPNMGLSQAFEAAALADQHRTTDKEN